MSFLSLSHLSKTYTRGAEPVVRDLSLDVEKGEIVVLLGSSGCGKTTLLKMIAGLETQDTGTISIDGANMEGISAEKRPLAMVFQKALLFRNMTVEQNINFAPRVNRTMGKAELAAKVEEMLRLIDMEGMGRKKATELSGGQEQRVSLARALITNPKVLLLDEPFSALDAKLRVSMRQHIKRLNRTLGTTMIFVTHDQQEAVEVADRIALMHDGRILQYGTPLDFYERPNSRAVADFFGWRNFIPAHKDGNHVTCVLGEWEFGGCCGGGEAGAINAANNPANLADGLADLPDGPTDSPDSPTDSPDGPADLPDGPTNLVDDLADLADGPADLPDSPVELAIRPEAACNVGGGSLEGTVVAVAPQGPFSMLTVECAPKLSEDENPGAKETSALGSQEALNATCDPAPVVLDLLVKATEAPGAGETLRFDLAPRMMWPLEK